MWLGAAAIYFVYHKLFSQHLPRHSFSTKAFDETPHCCQSLDQLKLKSRRLEWAKLNMYPSPNKCIDDQLFLNIIFQIPSNYNQSCRKYRSMLLIWNLYCTDNALQNNDLRRCVLSKIFDYNKQKS